LPEGIGAAVIGTGFIGTVHLQALRRLGVRVAGVLGSGEARGAERARALGTRAFASLDDLLADPGVDVVHVTSPNHLHFAQVLAVLAAGKHVVCEKPLAMTAAESAEMVARARAGGRVAAVCYNTRFYPLNQQARGMVEAGELGEVRLVTGHYHQDWLAKESDWNWRLTPEAGGALRAVGDIGTHWLDLTSFIAGMAPSEVFADLATLSPSASAPRARWKPSRARPGPPSGCGSTPRTPD
jgi:predicted dehydrogenase